MQQTQTLDFEYRYGFAMPHKAVYQTKKGLTPQVIEEISSVKNEPSWMRQFRLKAYEIFLKKPLPAWGGDLSQIDFNNIIYFAKATDRQADTWEKLPQAIKETYDRIGIPEAEKKFLAGVSAQYDSEVVYESVRRELDKQGVIFCDMDTGLKKYPDLVRQYFGTLIPPPRQ